MSDANPQDPTTAKFRSWALLSYVHQEVCHSLKINKINVSKFLIDIARKSDSIENFGSELSKRKVSIPVDLKKYVFGIVKRHDAQNVNVNGDVKMELHEIQQFEPPKVGEILKGRVTSVNAHGAFIKLENYPGKPIGFCHKTEMKSDPTSELSTYEILGVGERLFVKVVESVSNVIALSIRGIDQKSGKNIEEVSFTSSVTYDSITRTQRMKASDKFELEQLVNAGALKQNEIYEYSGNYGMLSMVGDNEEDFEIALNTNIPPFLEGLKKEKSVMEPTKVQVNPEGSLIRGAREATRLAKERQEQRRLQSISLTQGNVSGLLDDETPSIIPKGSLSNLPEWKRQSFNSFGPLKKSKNDLPIQSYKERIHNMIVKNRVFILVGETGCGKTTQIPQFLHEWGIGNNKMIAITQPRRVAAISVAKRVAQEMNTIVGDLVGYSVRFDECLSKNTKIKYVTDGMLLKECLSDRKLADYGVIMLDEAHERTINTDVLFGLMKEILETNSDIKIIVTSATLQQEKFSEFFNNCPVLNIPGRTFPVQTSYISKPVTNYLDTAVQTVLSLHSTEPMPGDILLFLTGQDDIDTACEMIYHKALPMEARCGKLIVLPIYSTLPSEQQSMIFEETPPGSRKVVVATNIAETSITIDGIRYVVDPGFVKELWYDPKIGMDTLKIVPISKAAANQRKGRAGRTAEGKCLRLYTEEAFNKEMKDASTPEIQRSNMAMVALQLKAIGIDDLINFDFMDKPPMHTIIDALEQLYVLGALDEEGNLTLLGNRMAQFPLSPQLSKMLISSAEMGCSEEIIIIVAILSVQGIWYRPRQKQANADAMKARLNREEGDHLTLLHVYREWCKHGKTEQWCRDNFVHYRSLKRAEDVIIQLHGLMYKYHLPIKSCGNDKQLVVKSIVSGFFAKASRRDGQKGYNTLVDNHLVHLHPGSALFGRDPDFVVYNELVNTSKEFMRNVVAVDPKWLVELAPAFYRKASPTEITRRKRSEHLAPLEDRYREHERDWRITEQRIVRL